MDPVRALCTLVEVVAAITVVWAFVRAIGRGSLALYVRSVGMAMLLLTLAGRSSQKLAQPATWALIMVAVSLLVLVAGYLLQISEDRRAHSLEDELRAEIAELHERLERVAA